MGNTLWRDISISSTCDDDKICPLPSCSCFQQHFHNWFYVFRYNSDLSKLEFTLILFKLNCIRDLTNRRKLFSIPVAEYTCFSHQVRTLRTNLLGLISNVSKCKIEKIFWKYKPNIIVWCPENNCRAHLLTKLTAVIN